MKNENAGKKSEGHGKLIGWISTFVVIFSFFAIITNINSIPQLFEVLFGWASKPVTYNTPKQTSGAGKVEQTKNNTPISPHETVSPDYSIPEISDSLHSVNSINIETIKGNIKRENQNIEYKFIPKQSGIHHFEFSGIKAGTNFKLEIFDSLGERLDYNNALGNGGGVTVSLAAGKTYKVRVTQYTSVGAYTLSIGKKKSTIDISQYNIITDSIQYKDQENDYIYTAGIEGIHRFEFSGIKAGTNFKLEIFDSLGERLDYNNALGNGGGVTVSLAAGKIYKVRVTQYTSVGAYTLSIGKKKSTIDISQYNSITDSIQYKDQENDYIYTTGVDGIHRFEFSGTKAGTNFKLEIFDSLGERLDYNNALGNGGGVTVSLVAGQTYKVRVTQYTNVGAYQLNITLD